MNREKNTLAKEAIVYVSQVESYNLSLIYQSIPDHLFDVIKKGNTVVIKPNWIRESHLNRPDEWEQVITHPTVITAVLKKVLEKLQGKGKICIIDGPETSSSFEKILAHYGGRNRSPLAGWFVCLGPGARTAAGIK